MMIKKQTIISLFILVFAIGNVVLANEIPKEIANPLIQEKKVMVVSNEYMKLCSEYEPHLDELTRALEKCMESDSACPQCLSIMAQPEHATFYFQMQDRMPRIYESNRERREKKLNELQSAMREKIGPELSEKLKKQGVLLESCEERLHKTQEKMRNEIDLSQFNAQLPDALAQLCRQSRNGLVENRCEEIQKMFHWKEARSRGQYSPFIRASARNRLLYDNVVVNQDDLKKNVTGLCNHLELSETTTDQLVQLTMDGYNRDGKCEKGPVLNLQQEQEIWASEKDQRERKNIAHFIRKLLENGVPNDQISSSLYTLRSATQACRQFDELSKALSKRFGAENQYYHHFKEFVAMRVACERTPAGEAYENWNRCVELHAMIGKTDDEEKKQILQKEQDAIAKEWLGKS
jgi:hypothetical protein